MRFWETKSAAFLRHALNRLGDLNEAACDHIGRCLSYVLRRWGITGVVVFCMLMGGGIIAGDRALLFRATFIAKGTGAAERDAMSKLRDVVSVKDFGAVGDGSTDDTTAIQAAIDFMSSGGTVTFPCGTYKITAALTVQVSGVTLRGCGMGTTSGDSGGQKTATTIKNTGTGNAITITKTAQTLSNVAIYDLIVLGQAGTADGIRFNNTNNCLVQNVSSRSNVGSGLVLEDSNLCSVIGGRFWGNTLDGILITKTSFSANSNYLYAISAQSNGEDGVRIVLADGTRWFGGDSETNTGKGLNFLGGRFSTIEGVWFEGNGADWNFATSSAVTPDGNALTGNLLVTAATSTVDTGSNNYFAGNRISGNVTLNAGATNTVWGAQVRIFGTFTDNGIGTYNMDRNSSGFYIRPAGGGGQVFAIGATTGAITIAAGQTIDTVTNGTLGLGTATATTLTLGRSGQGTTLAGDVTASSTKTKGTCTLNGGSPSTCTATVVSGATCTAATQGTTAAAATHTVAVSVTTTTLTVTGANGLTDVVNYHCLG